MLDPDFDRVRRVLVTLCADHPSWKPKNCKPLANGRPKFQIHVDGSKSDLLSVVPVYESGNVIEFRANTTVRLPLAALTREERQIDSLRFVSPPAAVIRDILRSLLEERVTSRDARFFLPGKGRRKDAKAILPSSEYQDFVARFAALS